MGVLSLRFLSGTRKSFSRKFEEAGTMQGGQSVDDLFRVWKDRYILLLQPFQYL
jgi:hypothetical protein